MHKVRWAVTGHQTTNHSGRQKGINIGARKRDNQEDCVRSKCLIGAARAKNRSHVEVV